MKKNSLVISFFSLVILLLTGCESSNSYSNLIAQERAKIANYLRDNNFEVLDKMPKDSVFTSKQFYQFPNNGIYIQLMKKGRGDTLRLGDEIVLRYTKVSLDQTPIEENYWTTMDRPYPEMFPILYGSTSNSCEGWQTAFSVMRRTDSEALIIVPSKKGMNSSVVEPYLYHFKIKRVLK